MLLPWIVQFALSLAALGCTAGEIPVERADRAWSGRKDDTDGRLPLTLIPYHYNVELFPDFYHDAPPFYFTGKVSIWFNCTMATDVITINNNGLSVDDSSISVSISEDTPGNPTAPVLVNWEYNAQAQFLHFNLEQELEVNEHYVISMAFIGQLHTPGEGLYWDRYEDETGKTVYVAGTQFESIDARQAYPSFDEPDLKATFNTTVVYRDDQKAFANTPIIAVEDRGDGWLANVYATTPIMSTYLLCIVIGDYVNITSGNINGYDVNIWTRPQLVSQIEYAASISAIIQAWLEDETQHPYPVAKMDHISLPSKGGAMENYGLITYGEESIVINPATSPATARLNVASIVSHELAHQWYGNLVTCKWWDDVWLNEGFATNYNYYPTEVIGWKPSETQQVDTRRGSLMFMDADARNNSDPIRKNISSVFIADISFSGSTYPKGGAMLRMISSILTESTFKNGLIKYLETKKNTGAVSDDLWNALSSQAATDGITNPDGSALDMKARMDPWLNQMGYPLVTVTRGAGGTAVASRTHFLNPANQVMDTSSPYNYEWDVPLTVVTSDSITDADWDAPPVAWIDIDDMETTLTGLPQGLNDWFIVNSKGRMFYRVHYDDDSRQAIVRQLENNPRLIEGQTKTQFIDDTFTIAKVGLIPATEAMATTTFLADEFTYNPWYPAVKHFQYIQRLIPRESWYSSYRAYITSLSAPVYSGLGWTYYDYETPLEQYLRRDMISLSCSFGDVSCFDAAISQYYLARDDPTKDVTDPNNLPTVLCSGIQTFASNWDMWFAEYTRRVSSQVREERYAYLFGLSCTNLRANLNAYMTALIGDGIAARDKNTAAGYLALNDIGAVLLWEYLEENWQNTAFSGKFATLTAIANGFSNQAGLDQLNAFIARHPPTSQSEINSYDQMILNVQQNIEWLNNNSDSLGDWLAGKALTHTQTRDPLLVSSVHHWNNVAATYERDMSHVELF